MSEATPSPDPQPRAGAGRSDPTAPPTTPGPAPWAPPDPLAAPQPWAAPDPWTPTASPLAWTTPRAPGSDATATGGPDAVPPASGGSDGALPPLAAAPPGTVPPAAGRPSPGHPAPTWPAPGSPPPFAHPAAPPTPTNGGRTAAIVVSVATVLAIVVCGCFGVGLMSVLWHDQPVAEEPYDPYQDPYDDAWTEPTTSPTPAWSQQPVTRPTSGPAPVQVVYEVTGDGRADIAYFDAESDLIHVDGVKLPWRTTIRTNGKSRIMVEATWSDGIDRPISCKVTVTGAGAPVTNAVDGYWRTTCSPE